MDHNKGHVSSEMFPQGDAQGYSMFPNGQDDSLAPNWNYDMNHAARSHSSSLQPSWRHDALRTFSPAASASTLHAFNSGSYPGSPALHNADYRFNGTGVHFPHSLYDPSLMPTSTISGTNFGGQIAAHKTANAQSGTIAPEALQNHAFSHAGRQSPKREYETVGDSDGVSQGRTFAQSGSRATSTTSVDSSTGFQMPKGVSNGAFVVTDYDALVRLTKSKRLHNYVNVGDSVQEIPITKTTIPVYLRRNSRNDYKKLAAGDKALLAKIARKTSRKRKDVAPTTDRSRMTTSLFKAPGSVSVDVTESSSETESSDDASAYESSEEEAEVAEPSPLPNSRPQAALEATTYDAIKALWRPRNRVVNADDIREGLKSYWDLVRTIRDRWKSDAAAVKEAEEKKRNSELPLLEDRVKSQRDMIEVALKAALQHGHKNITELFGENQSLIYLYNQFLADRARNTDYDSMLSQSILQLLLQCKTLSNDTLEKTGMSKVLPRFARRGNEKTRDLVKSILSKDSLNPSTGVPIKLEKSADSKPHDLASKLPPSVRPAVEAVAGIKRQRPSEMSNGQPQKKLAAGSASPTSKGPNPTRGFPSEKKRTSAPAEAKPTSTVITAAATKPKALQVTAKPSGFFLNLQSAQKKPGTSNAALAAAKDKLSNQNNITKEKRTATTVATSSSAKPAFSFAETMANLAKPKETEPTAKPGPEDKVHVETEEQKAKRLRKESRRALRVSFKPDDELVQLRYFTHDPEEEIGHDANMVRDVGDIGGEGRMFKQHKDMMDLDDEDESPSNEESPRQYIYPSLIDFDVVDQGERNRNYKPFGGGYLEPTSPEVEVQKQREATTLMVFYPDPSDIPPFPREPADPYAGAPTQTTPFGPPPEHILARTTPTSDASQAQSSQAATISAPTQDLSALLSILNGQQSLQQQQQQQQQQQHQQAIQQQPPLSDLERIFAQHSVQASQPTAAPPPQAPPASLFTFGPAVDMSAYFSAMGQQQAPQQQPPGFAPAPVTANLSAILAQLQQPTVSSTTQQQAMGYPFENEERRQWREMGGADADGGDKPLAIRGGGAGDKTKKSGKKFIVPCRYWKSGQCKKGAECTFVHD